MRSPARIHQPLGLRFAVVVLAALAAAGSAAAATSSTSSTSSSSTAPAPTSVSQAQQQLSAGRRRASQLAGTLSGATRQVGDLGTSIAVLQSRVSSLQSGLYKRRDQLLRVRDQLDAAQLKLGGLQAAKAAAERVLAEQLVGSYEVGRPDIISVVLESTGFNDLLERVAFAERVGRTDARIVAHVRSARRAVAREAETLGRLTARAQHVADRVLSERDQVARFRLRLIAQQLAAAKTKAAAAGQLASAQVQVDQLTQRLAQLQAAQPASSTHAAPRTSAESTGNGARPSGGAMPFPLAAGEAAPPATWTLGEGVDIAAPADTPELAVCSGTVVLHGIGGMGPSAPVLRCAQPIAGYAYVYYGFAGTQKLAAVGANVVRGQQLAQVGPGIIATSTGPHLEIGFADASGAPLGPTAARQMLALVRAAYAS